MFSSLCLAGFTIEKQRKEAMSTQPKILVVVHDIDDHLNEMANPIAEAGILMDTWDVVNDGDGRPVHQQRTSGDGNGDDGCDAARFQHLHDVRPAATICLFRRSML